MSSRSVPASMLSGRPGSAPSTQASSHHATFVDRLDARAGTATFV
ncbi:hypothetical protein A7982_13614 [Minicystis rosea]|nr:hypothetical protein A7982_13614 [Minicystis rosea]